MPTLEKLSPFRDLDVFERRMRRLFSDFPVPVPFLPALTPAADVYETDDELVVELEVPGYEEKELDVAVVDHTLVVRGAREETTEKEEKTVRLHERLASTFERRFELPPQTDAEHASASYRKGLLTLHVPKTAEAARRTIPIT
jgi:HSP20 family protein